MERVEVYVDESGHSSEGSIFAMGAIAGTANQWSLFDSEWLETMSSAGFSAPFHAVEFEGLRGQFECLRADRLAAVALHERLTDIINRRTLAMLGVIVPLEMWRQMDDVSRRKNDPYVLAMEALIEGLPMSFGMSGGSEYELAFFFEKRKDTAGAAERMFSAIQGHPEVVGRERLRTFAFGDKSSARLQAADLVAYEVRKRAIDELDGRALLRWQSRAILPRLYVGSVTITRKDT